MSWKNTLGQFIGIFIGVSAGAGLVHYMMGGRRAPPEAQQYPQQTNYQNSNSGIFDQAVANIKKGSTNDRA